MFSSALKSFTSNISSNYQISPTATLVSGPWKVYDGKKKSTGNAASIFVFERKSLDSRSSGFGNRSSNSSTKKLHDEVVERLKREASTLSRLRHPSILQVLEPVEETRNGGLMFATEPVTASLSGILQEKDRESRYAAGANGAGTGGDVEMDELEIQKGLLQIAKGLEFLHESAGLVHGNLNPQAIFINAKSDWKIAGLAFAGPADSSETPSSVPPLALSEILYHDPRLPNSVQLDLDYTSPDFVMDSHVTPSADLFSLGLVIVSIYNSPHVSPLQTHSNLNTYKKLLSSPSSTPTKSNGFLSSKPLPDDLASHVLPRLITRRPAQRMNAREFQQSQYFDNVLVSTIRFLESWPTKTPNEKSQFLRGLQRVLAGFPTSVLERKVLGILLEETKDRELLSLILQNIFKIIERSPNSRKIFPERVIPRLKEIFLASGNKAATRERDTNKEAGLMAVLENMNVIAENCSGREFKEDVLPLIRLGMESPTHALVDAAMKCLSVILPVLDFSTVKNEVFPPIASTFSKTASLAIKVRGLEAFVVLCGGSIKSPSIPEDDLSGVVQSGKSKKTTSSILDKYTVQEKLVPLLRAIKTKEPAVMMAALKVFREVGKIADTDFLALEVLPVLWNFSLGPLLNLKQFEEYMAVIKSLSAKIEHEQTKKLQELSSTNGSDLRNGSRNNSAVSGLSGHSAVDETNDSFERLVLGKSGTSNAASNDLWEDWSSQPSAVTKTSTQPSTPTFAWSSNAKGTTSLANNQSSIGHVGIPSRTITPDLNMSAFPSLEPAKRHTASSVASLSTGQSPSSMSNLGSFARTASSSSIPTAGGTGMQSNYSAFTIPPPPSTTIQTTTTTTTPRQSQTMSIPTPQNTTSFGSTQNPWANLSSPNALSNNSGSFSAGQQQQKQGLDKYESLL
ncbi:hypothetical protein DTO207G8_8110 [Paecilomyces variotii]|nr:hypothetical protein DTO207G8_8110 [Paecilomyces variotii]KAJ9408517.1 hypothetical protein DTO045G8_3810 [Paecilomyces variotii]